MEKHSQRWLDSVTIIGLLLAIWLVALRLQMTDWTKKLELGSVVVLIGFVIGLGLGYSFYNKKAVFWLATAFSFFTLAWQISLQLDMEGKISDRLYQLGIKIWQAFLFFIQNRPIPNAYLFVSLMLLLLWLVAISAGYTLARYGRPWVPLFLSGVALVIIDQYSTFVKGRNFISGVFIFVVLFLIGRIYYLKKQEKWEQSGALVDYGLGFDVGRSMAASGLIIVLVTWSIPGIMQYFIPGSVPQQKMVEFWKPLRERLSNTVADLQSPRVINSRFFGENMALGTQATEGESPIFLVDVSSRRSLGLRYYWRAFSYDTYSDGGWSNSFKDQESINPEEWPLETQELKSRKQVDLVFHVQFANSTTLYSPGLPVSVNIPVKLIAQLSEEGNFLNDIAMFSPSTLKGGDSYRLRASVGIPNAVQLEESSAEYPDWILETYLQLPDGFPQRIRNLAGEITRQSQTPYEKTMAITDYLRSSIEYSKSIEPAPGYYDPIDWFLFVQEKGYCNYYASAEVLMLRSVGIPARLAVGFAQGVYIKETESFQVSFNDSHAWPEVYFPEIGWIEFEPTVSQPDIHYQAAAPQMLPGQPGYNGGGINAYLYERMFDERLDPEYAGDYFDIQPVTQPTRFPYEYLLLIPVLLVIAWLILQRYPRFSNLKLPIILERFFRKRGQNVPGWIKFFADRARMSPIERNFSEIAWMLRLLGKRVTSDQTPSEKISLMVSLLPEIKAPAEILLNEYQKSSYSPYRGDEKFSRKAHSSLWKYVIGYYFKALTNPDLTGN